MTWLLTYGERQWELNDGDVDRISRILSVSQGVDVFEFHPENMGGTVRIALGSGIPFTLETGDD